MLVLGNVHWFTKIWQQLATRPQTERPFVALWHYEPLPLPTASGFPRPRLHLYAIMNLLRRNGQASEAFTNYFQLWWLMRKQLLDLLVVSTRGGYEFLAERGVAAHWVPLGYDPSLGCDLGLPRDIDALFIGELKVARRRRLIKRLQQEGISLLAVGGKMSDLRYWGENRTRLTAPKLL
jgi:hypothetical protein